MVAGVECPLFHADDGALFQVPGRNLLLGDRIRVEGINDVTCVSDCQQGGCITSSVIKDASGDTDCDGCTGFGDLVAVLSNWGTCNGCSEDLDDSGDVGFTDLLRVLSGWGAVENA